MSTPSLFNNFSNTIYGCCTLMESITCPPELTTEGNHSPEAKIAHLKACNEHLNQIHELIFDLATVLDRLSGGSTIVLHHPGATPLYADVVSQDISVHAYLNPHNLANHPELHQIAAQPVQLFAKEWALPVAQSFHNH
ncbi:hypothetical protein JVU11DRAFT_6007 [Chiua virens]|nr:hypothetical protein JVU11DRAFT_6007 [Chiua virens]